MNELETTYTVDDVIRANAALQVQQSIDNILGSGEDNER